MIQYNNMKPNPFGLRFIGKFTLKHIHLQIKRGKTYPANTALSFKIVLHLGEYCYFIADIGASLFSDFMISPYEV